MHDSDPTSGITDSQLLAYLEDSADPEIVEQIERSEEYKKRASRLANEQKSVLGQLFRLNCPDTVTLGEYYLGQLSKEESTIVSNHLTRCPYCTRELAIYNESLDDEASQESIVTKLKILVGRILPNDPPNNSLKFPPIATQPVRLAARGNENDSTQTRVYTTDGGIEIILSIFPASNNRKSLKGLLIGTPKERLEVHLWYQESRIGSFSVDPGVHTGESGSENFSFDNLEDGTYELIVQGSEILVHIQSFTV